MCAGINQHLLKSLGVGQTDKTIPTDYGTNAAGQNLYPDGTANVHSGPANQESLRISQPSQGTLKGNTTLNPKKKSTSSDVYNT